MKLYNTLTREKQEFIPIQDKRVGIYVCGPTVYNYIHVGNARPMVIFDTLRRYLRYRGYDVKYVSNFTDIDDKIIEKAKENKVDFKKITEKYIEAYIENAEDIGFDEKNTIHPRATEFIPQMIDFVKKLEDKGCAYNCNGNVYFDVSKAHNYGHLSKKNIEDLISGARVENSEEKKSPIDFALWKRKKEADEPSWDSPWGQGRPGWHLECSVMSQSILGDTIDIHAGGEDLSFPHHENEVAQSETLTGKPMANFWLHNSMITVDNEKMSKSKGNFFLLNDIQNDFNLEVVRLWLLGVHYRKPINFSRDVLEQSKNGLDRLYNGKNKLINLLKKKASENEKPDNNLAREEADIVKEADKIEEYFQKVMDDDLNTADGVTALYDLVKLINTKLDEKVSSNTLNHVYEVLTRLSEALGLLYQEQKEEADPEIEALIEARTAARKQKDFKKADEIRDLLAEKGISIKDTRDGVVWERIK